MGLSRSRRRAPRAVAVVAICAATLVAGYLLKAQCTRFAWDGRQYARLCYNDIQALYEARGLDRGALPYLHGTLADGELDGGALEYPVLTGLFMWGSARLVSDATSYLGVSALLLASFGLVTAYLLERLSGWRALLWSAAPALALYAFHNWDLLAVATVVGALWTWRRGHPLAAAALLGVGGAVKLYPLLLLVPLALDRWHAGDRRGAIAALGAGAGAAALVNLPFVIANFDGWWATYGFHALRVADFNSIWYWGARSVAFDPATLNLISGALSAGSFAAALAMGARNARARGTYPFVQVSGALVAAFMLWSKVHSPQYALWILPFFVVMRVGVGWWVAYALADLTVYVGIFRWFYELEVARHPDALMVAKVAAILGVWARAALLVALFVVFLRAKVADNGAGEPAIAASSSYPASRVHQGSAT